MKVTKWIIIYSNIGIKIFVGAIMIFVMIARLSAAPLGLPQNTAKIGFAVGGAYVFVDDPAGESTNDWALMPLSLIYTDWLTGDIRYWTEIYYYQAALEASATHIGQNVKRFGGRFSIQKSFRITKEWSPWFGVGVDLSRISFTARHRVDDDGFLIESFPNRSEGSAGLVFNMFNEWSISNKWSMGIKLEQSVPIKGDLMEFMATVDMLYRY